VVDRAQEEEIEQMLNEVYSINLAKESLKEHQLSDLLVLLSDMWRKWAYPEPNLHLTLCVRAVCRSGNT